MASTDGHLADEAAQPRSRKPTFKVNVNGNEQTAKSVQSSHDRLSVLSKGSNRDRSGSAPPSENAPPSVKATSAARRQNRQKSKRMFPTIDYEARVSYFDPSSDYTNFKGFFVLFWVGLAIMVITQVLRNLRESGTLLNFRQWPLFRENIEELAITDFLMCGSTMVSLSLQLVFKDSPGILKWSKMGVYIQSLWQAAWFSLWVMWPFLRDWTWTAQVFFILHTLCMFMKMHSYAFYCGHLSTTLFRLKQLDLPIGPATPTNAAFRYPLARTRTNDLTGQETVLDDQSEHHQDGNISPIVQLRDDLAMEITSPLGNVTYPANLTVSNFLDFLMVPTLCYELEYPRRPTRSYLELFWKALAVFGCVFLMIIVSEEFIIPILDESQARLAVSRTSIDNALIFAETVSRLLFPFMITFLLVFLSIFEYVLGFFAEITRFADRRFYSDWWNSLDWLEFSREWNIPVHNFFRRHIYGASRGVKLSRPAATGITFFISALAHELIMGSITRKFRGYGFFLMMLQMPLVLIQRMPFLRNQQLLKNIMFWISMITGLSLLCALYVLV
ncbi:MBOAT-domain-containing protein [Dissoconium aciculare CBS 342.82]|uniref:O-acyltransferase n=1 Tax=Dissoconium aciculare CBS 342.82 TaxID=1314786 RepID=A0A6J3MIZ1_9PEZI|nr:MBOAT-domain-containing protein [Dissoconium aciculare CBS 342.82]KAF1827684.1 MBOAT-domain-containing protein [Dissoconium aciculare CBS 342.82]